MCGTSPRSSLEAWQYLWKLSCRFTFRLVLEATSPCWEWAGITQQCSRYHWQLENTLDLTAPEKAKYRPTFEDLQVNQWVGASSLNQQHTSMTSVQFAISCWKTEETGWKRRRRNENTVFYDAVDMLAELLPALLNKTVRGTKTWIFRLKAKQEKRFPLNGTL